jgi:prepilin signal peptidase PulO-like enzyme (type II secretory pathway)
MVVLSFPLFFIGIFFGSFFLVLIDRIPAGKSPFVGRSHCDTCGHTLGWTDLIPVISFVLLRGRCRYCRKSFSYMYPLLEVLTGVLFALTPYFLASSSEGIVNAFDIRTLLFSLFVIATFIVIFVTDLRYGIIPFLVVIPAVILTIFYQGLTEPSVVIHSVLSAVCAAGFFLLLYLVTKGKGMGLGDVVLVVYLGLLLSFPGIVTALYIAFLTGAAVSLILIIGRHKKLRGSTIPFGPFLIFGAFLAYFWGDQLLQLFTRLFLH